MAFTYIVADHHNILASVGFSMAKYMMTVVWL